jgi:hypothetical protein
MGVTNLIAILKTNGCYLGAQQQFSATDNNVLCDCWTYLNPMMMIGPTNAYRDGYSIGQWGMRHIWIGSWPTLASESVFRHLADNFNSGLYNGAASVNGSLPTLELSYGISTYPDYTWLPETFNAIYANPANLSDPQTLKPCNYSGGL